jgi:hypothetical protein
LYFFAPRLPPIATIPCVFPDDLFRGFEGREASDTLCFGPKKSPKSLTMGGAVRRSDGEPGQGRRLR